MATAEQIKSLIRSHWSEDQERFYTVALQVAAHEAEQGHGALALEIRDLVDRARRESAGSVVVDFPPELQGLVRLETFEAPLSSLVLPPPLIDRILRIIHEYRQREKLHLHALGHRRKILLTGPPGTGKTFTARVLAHELRLPLQTVQVDKLVTKFMGETSAKLRLTFDLIQRREGVYFFDEFDAIAGGRTFENDVGEMRRVLNALLQFIEQDRSDSLILAATNSPGLLDRALFRRFDDVLNYDLPGEDDRKRLVANILGAFTPKPFAWSRVLAISKGLSQAEIDIACRDALKRAVLDDTQHVTALTVADALKERSQTHPR
ncbi:ATP-binding protein [bacterium]|nr:ATP-binding protein [bacterium]